MLKTSQEIQDHIEDLRIKAQAIVDVAKGEERDLTDEEQKSFDKFVDEADGLESKDLVNAQKREDLEAKARQAKKLQNRAVSGEIPFEGSDKQRFDIPARARASRKLVAYDNEKDAYIAGNVILGGVFGNRAAIAKCESLGLRIHNALGEGVNSTGGFLVPDEMQRALIRLREEYGVFPRYARNYPMGSDTAMVPRLLSDVTAGVIAENSEMSDSDVTIGSAELVAKKFYAMSRISTEIDEDSVVDVGEMVTQSMAYALAVKIDECGFNGDGTSTYGGIVGLKNALNSSAIIDAASGNDAANNLDLADFEDVMGAYPEYAGAQPRWFMHKAVFWASYGRLQQAAGGNTVADLGNGPVPMIGGYPVVFTQCMPSTTGTLASTIIAYFGDLRLGATIGTRRAMNTMVSADRYFEFDQIAIRSTERIAINIHERGDTIRTRPILALKTAS